ncbi:MAG TPA: malto-oligosyltrehalose synthase [Frankiaceae bacterium]|nr:malto-oligosyltrehalose synthase [Frankiaceae bacterium]
MTDAPPPSHPTAHSPGSPGSPGSSGSSGAAIARHVPAPGKPIPTSTYRVQLTPEFGFDDAAAVVPYLAELGVSHLYCSPFLQAAPGSDHGYDVVDHTRMNEELGGEAGHGRLVETCREFGLGLVVDVVPNHMAISGPESQNAAWWDVLRHGPASRYASWFDIDWETRDNPGRVLVPVLGSSLAGCLADGEITIDRTDATVTSLGGPVVRYYEHEVPLAPGTAHLELPEALDRQFWRLCDWRIGGEELNYRRFFDVTTLAGIRVEDESVFAATHERVLEQIADGSLDGLRIDHPDGLADPEGYLRRLADATGGAWVVVEKILEGDESLPESWPCAGTTGYEALNLVNGLFVDPRGEQPLTTLYGELTREPTDWDEVRAAAKGIAVREVLPPELNRLSELLVRAAWADRRTRDLSRRGLREALEAVLEEFDVYRAYVTPGQPAPAEARETVTTACGAALRRLPGRAAEIAAVARLALAGPGEFVVRFQQTCGPVMAKGVEDTAFYRYHRLAALNEVGGDPAVFGVAVDEFHRRSADTQARWPLTMTTLSTHDTKRAEDVRARLALLSEDPAGWASAAGELMALGERHVSAAGPDRNAIYLLLQTLVGASLAGEPLDADRAVAYLEKATREAKQHTSWTSPDTEYDEALQAYVRGVLADPQFVARLSAYIAPLVEAGRVNGLAQKLVQLTMPGVPDVYQGTERWALSLVDPDNRRPVDFGDLARMLATTRGTPRLDDSGAAKLHLVRAALQVRRAHPEWFGVDGDYQPLTATGAAADYVLAFARAGRCLTIVPRLALGLRRAGGWKDTAVPLPPGTWVDAFTGRRHGGAAGDSAYLLKLLRDFPVALLVPAED